MESDGTDNNVPSPKVPTRNLSSHNYVVQFRKNQFQTPKRKAFNVEDSKQQNLFLNKNKMTNLNKDVKGHQPFENQNVNEDDEKNNINWRPLRDFF